MTNELAQIIHENFNKCRGRNGVPPSALAEVIESSDWLRKVKADAWSEGYAGGQDSIYTATSEWPTPDIRNPYWD